MAVLEQVRNRQANIRCTFRKIGREMLPVGRPGRYHSTAVDVVWLAEEVRRALRFLRAGTVLAVWEDGSLTAENFAFWARRNSDGSYDAPVTTFVAGTGVPSRDEVVERLVDAAERWRHRGGPWTPASADSRDPVSR